MKYPSKSDFTMKNLVTTIALFLFCLFFLPENGMAQQRFKAGLIFGLNASQLEGDDSAGYNKLGLHGGLRGVTMLKDKMDLIIEMLYSQRGSFAKFVQGDMKVNLQYVEIPVMVSYKDWYLEDEEYFKVQAVGGLTYSRLLKASAIGSQHDGEVENFNNNDFGITLGADFFIRKHLAIGGRWNRSFNLLYDHDKHDPNLDSLFGYFLSFRAMFVF